MISFLLGSSLGDVLSFLLGSSLGGLLSLGLFKILQLWIWERSSTIRHLPGPPNPSLLFGNFHEIWAKDNSVPQEAWVKEYGPTIQYRGLLSASRLYTTDLKALNHIIMNADVWQKPENSRRSIAQVVGAGVLVEEGEAHKRQRRIMNPAFSRAQIKDLTEIFVTKSLELKDIWTSKIRNAQVDDKSNALRIDVLSWLGRATLDIIGLAGFNYSFNSLSESADSNELNSALNTLLGSGGGQNPIMMILQFQFPFIFKWLPTERTRSIAQAHSTMNRIGLGLIKESKERFRTEKITTPNRDLLSLLVHANMADEGADGRKKLSDRELLAQIPTFFIAGNETTSAGVTWALYALTQAPEVQKKLRKELRGLQTDTPTMDELNSLVYLDQVVRETMRLHCPVPSTGRECVRDDVIPLSVPLMDANGVLQNSLYVKKGTKLLLPILTINRSEEVWGPDSREFRPERWSSIPSGATSIPGIWGNMLTFIGGPRSCVGYMFSLIEMKALLFTLVKAFEFELAVPAADIGKKTNLVQRPVLHSQPNTGNQMPLLVKFCSEYEH